MSGLHIDHFLSAGTDFEKAQYTILNHLQTARKAFWNNEIYPHLGSLVKLFNSLKNIVGQIDLLQDAAPGELKELDLEEGRLVYEKADLSKDQVAFVEDLIRWSLPHIRKAIEEGRTVYEFVEDHLELEEVGIMPSYREEGYLFVPDRQTATLHILQYKLSVFTEAGERYRSLRTTHVKSLYRKTIYPSPHSLKLDLLSERKELPNPATYAFETELDFPFSPTLLPVAKRKLIQYLAEEDNQA